MPLDDNQPEIKAKDSIFTIRVLNSFNLLIPNLNRLRFGINSKLTLGKRFWAERFILLGFTPRKTKQPLKAIEFKDK